MRAYLEIENTGKINILEHNPYYGIISFSGMNQPPRNFAAEWKWKEDGKDGVLIFISESLNKEDILERLKEPLEKAKSISGLSDPGFPKQISINVKEI